MDNQASENAAHPALLKETEADLVRMRPDRGKVVVGFALSGGGIRSATFSLGVFQALAKLHLLSKIDYISTVSGGGYFGSFLGRVFARPDVLRVSEVETILSPTPGTQGAASDLDWKACVFTWLRENGRYLAPNGAGDLLLGGAVLFRNWVAVQIVMATLVLMVLMAAQLIRGAVEVGFANNKRLAPMLVAYQSFLVCRMPWGQHSLWWSPYAILAMLVFLVCVVPPAWSYWLVERAERGTGVWISPVVGLIAVIILAASGVGMANSSPDEYAALLLPSLTLLLVTCWTGIWWLRSRLGDSSSQDENVRFRLSSQLKAGLVVTGVLLAFVIVDSLGQTLYTIAISDGHNLKVWTAGVIGPLVALAAFARKIVSAIGPKTNGKRLGVSSALLAGAAALIVTLLALTLLDTCSHAVVWDFGQPPSPLTDLTVSPKLIDARQVVVSHSAGGTLTVEAEQTAFAESQCPPTGYPRQRNWSQLRLPAVAFGILLLFSWLFGWSWPFLNRSSHHALYASRLIRAYLGASNKERLKPNSSGVTEVIPGDDIAQQDYWPLFSQTPDKSIYSKGAPLHLVNVTVNETLDARSQVEQHDRKGIGMAIGPVGISAGIRHHVVFDRRDPARPFTVFPDQNSYRMFHYGNRFDGEPLSLGNWTSISGAAISTGLGSRTSLGLSLLIGYANVRLGYWWDSGVDPASRKVRGGKRQRIQSVLNRVFRVQTFLFDEFLARFHGTARRWWYLSDGGHFENMGGYELIRRELEMIVVIDAEADSDYTFEGLANLVRKARLDFGAEIAFLDDKRLDDTVHGEVRKYFGTLDQLRRGTWSEEPVEDPNSFVPGPNQGAASPRKRRSINPENERRSLAHVALAEIRYREGQKSGVLLYVKPTLTGDEPEDVHRYHAEHPSFPQETTAEQFFDEAQWESYRKLGEHIASLVFEPHTGVNGKFLPHDLKPV